MFLSLHKRKVNFLNVDKPGTTSTDVVTVSLGKPLWDNYCFLQMFDNSLMSCIGMFQGTHVLYKIMSKIIFSQNVISDQT